MESLPQEIVLNILSRLPATSLVDVKFVCRAWRNITQDPLLSTMHFSHTAQSDPCLILHCDYPIRNQLYIVDLSTDNNSIETVKRFRVPIMPEFKVVGSCNGLLCLCDSTHSSSLSIYNPYTRDHIELPKSVECLNKDVVFGFGFHSTTREYKVVKVVCGRNAGRGFPHPGRLLYLQSEVQILTLGSSIWRSLGKVNYHFLQRPAQVLVSGRLHWVTWPRKYGPSWLLVSFDLADEQFHVMPKPDCGSLERRSFHLVVLGGCLSAAVHGNYGQIEIWVMKEYDVKESWIKKFSIGIHMPKGLENRVDQSFNVSKFYLKSSFVRVLCLLENGEILLEYKCRALVTYDSKRGTFKDLNFRGLPYLFETVVHVGNLNSIDTLIDM